VGFEPKTFNTCVLKDRHSIHWATSYSYSSSYSYSYCCLFVVHLLFIRKAVIVHFTLHIVDCFMKLLMLPRPWSANLFMLYNTGKCTISLQYGCTNITEKVQLCIGSSKFYETIIAEGLLMQPNFVLRHIFSPIRHSCVVRCVAGAVRPEALACRPLQHKQQCYRPWVLYTCHIQHVPHVEQHPSLATGFSAHSEQDKFL
jgi:hypothetical protein